MQGFRFVDSARVRNVAPAVDAAGNGDDFLRNLPSVPRPGLQQQLDSVASAQRLLSVLKPSARITTQQLIGNFSDSIPHLPATLHSALALALRLDQQPAAISNDDAYVLISSALRALHDYGEDPQAMLIVTRVLTNLFATPSIELSKNQIALAQKFLQQVLKQHASHSGVVYNTVAALAELQRVCPDVVTHAQAKQCATWVWESFSDHHADLPVACVAARYLSQLIDRFHDLIHLARPLGIVLMVSRVIALNDDYFMTPESYETREHLLALLVAIHFVPDVTPWHDVVRVARHWVSYEQPMLSAEECQYIEARGIGVCPILTDVTQFPVLSPWSGMVYDADSLLNAIAHHPVDPTTRDELYGCEITPACSFAEQVRSFAGERERGPVQWLSELHAVASSADHSAEVCRRLAQALREQSTSLPAMLAAADGAAELLRLVQRHHVAWSENEGRPGRVAVLKCLRTMNFIAPYIGWDILLKNLDRWANVPVPLSPAQIVELERRSLAICPLTKRAAREPVLSSWTGIVYERLSLLEALAQSPEDPVTHQPLYGHQVTPATALRALVA